MFAAVFCMDYLSLVLAIFFGHSASWKTGIHLLRGDSISLKLLYNSLAKAARRVSSSLFLMRNIFSLAFTISIIFRFTKLNQSKQLRLTE